MADLFNEDKTFIKKNTFYFTKVELNAKKKTLNKKITFTSR